jgi:hypothetical protein
LSPLLLVPPSPCPPFSMSPLLQVAPPPVFP